MDDADRNAAVETARGALRRRFGVHAVRVERDRGIGYAERVRVATHRLRLIEFVIAWPAGEKNSFRESGAIKLARGANAIGERIARR